MTRGSRKSLISGLIMCTYIDVMVLCAQERDWNRRLVKHGAGVYPGSWIKRCGVHRISGFRSKVQQNWITVPRYSLAGHSAGEIYAWVNLDKLYYSWLE